MCHCIKTIIHFDKLRVFVCYAYLDEFVKIEKKYVACVLNPHLGQFPFSITLGGRLTICLVARDERQIYLQSAPFSP